LIVRAALILLLTSGVAVAETHRVAVVVGNNAGNNARSALQFAEADAGKMARTLVELGGVRTDDLFLLQGRPLATVRETFLRAKERVAALHRDQETRVVLLFYFSGHSDGEVLELGAERLSFGELRRFLADTAAEVRVVVVDSCRSGALLAAKGGAPGPSFQIHLADSLASTGEAILTSSAADELALESTEIRGSFFTHHLISGLRGAADTSGDGLVTLAEAYQYAFVHTVSATSSAFAGSQHPAYDFRLSGQGELVLAELSHPAAALELPAGFDRILVVQLLRDQVLAELPAGAALRVVVPPGEYAVRALRGGEARSARVTVGAGETRVVKKTDLQAAGYGRAAAKGGPLSLSVTFASTTWGRAVIGTGTAAAAALVAAAVTGGLAVTTRSQLDQTCNTLCDYSRYDRAHALAIATDVLIGVGAASALTSLVLGLTRPRRSLRAAWAPLWTSAGAGLAARGAF
jgi:hypothetical protein